MLRQSAPALLVFGLFSLIGCASADPLTAASDRDFEYIARQEAILERASTAVESGECPAQCENAGTVCEASDAICRVAESTSDLDARARCRTAERRCLRARAAKEACPCS